MNTDAELRTRPPAPPGRLVRAIAGRRWLLAIVGVLLTAVLAQQLGEFGISILLAVAVTILLVTGLHLLVQWTGQMSLGQSAFLGTGALATAALNSSLGWPLPVAILGGVLAAAAASGIVGLPALRIRRFELAITTLAAGFAVDRWLFKQRWMVSDVGIASLRENSLFGLDIERQTGLVVLVAALVAIVILITARIGSSAVGRALRMIAADEVAAASYGINVGWHKFFAFVYAGACAGLAGAVYALVHPRSMAGSDFPPASSIVYLSVVLLGGPGPVLGTVLVGAGLASLPILLGGTLGTYLGLIASLGLLLVVRIRPGGLNEGIALIRRRRGGRS